MSPLGVTIYCREGTYGRDPKTRFQRAKRSFLKFVCKHELYGTLGPIIRQHAYFPEITWIEWERGPEKYNYGGYGFSRGYPNFDASRSNARDVWERKFKPHMESAVTERARESVRTAEQRAAALDRLAMAEHKTTRRFFKMLHAAQALSQ